MYRQCCITGDGMMFNNSNKKLPDINSCHIFPYAHWKSVSTSSKHLSPELIPSQWVSSGWQSLCTDTGLDDNCTHDYTGYHQICSLNNMISLRSDVHDLWDDYEIGVDVNVNVPIH
jgi:hypothetical protein